MKFQKFLEEKVTTVSTKFNESVDILENPRLDMIKKWTLRDRNNNLRWIITIAGELFAWSAWDETHQNIAIALGVTESEFRVNYLGGFYFYSQKHQDFGILHHRAPFRLSGKVKKQFDMLVDSVKDDHVFTHPVDADKWFGDRVD